VHNGSQKLYEQLGELARFVENALRTISLAGGPIASTSADLPVVASHLADLNKMTEDGTLEVMRLTELIQDNHSRTLKELAAISDTLGTFDCTTLATRVQSVAAGLKQDDQLLMQIMTALSFQDLVAQRVKKLVTILSDVQDKLMELVVVFGVQNTAKTGETAGKSGELLKQLEQSKTMAMKQDVADEILAQFGFK
jgi:chemotaxis protein CheZ